MSGSSTKEMSPSEKQQLRNDLLLYYSVPNLAGFRQNPTITEYLKVYTLIHEEAAQSWGAYVIEAYIMKDVLDTLTSTMTEITVELCNQILLTIHIIKDFSLQKKGCQGPGDCADLWYHWERCREASKRAIQFLFNL